MGQPKFEIKNSTNNQFYFNLKAGNGEIILTSETYTAKQSCKDGITSVMSNAQDEDNYEMKTAINGQYYFNLKASNGQVIGTSEQYTSTQGRDKGIASVMVNAPIAETVDLS